MSRRPFSADDDRFHFAELGDEWWATETAWFSFHVPERRLGGWLYTLARPNSGTLQGGAWVWDHCAHLPWEALYSANYSALPLPRDQDLDDCRLPTGVAIKVIEPTRAYALGYADGDRLRIDLRFDAVMAPQPLSALGSTFGNASHFDQFGRVHGAIVLHGERIAVDCIAMRDRTWGRRPEDRPRRAAYVTAAAGPDDGFLAVTSARDGREHISYGFLRKDGRNADLANGERIVERDAHAGWIRSIRVTLHDVEGRSAIAIGEPVSRIVVNRHTFIDVNSLVRWDLDGSVAWGEDQDMWPVHQWAEVRRAARRS